MGNETWEEHYLQSSGNHNKQTNSNIAERLTDSVPDLDQFIPPPAFSDDAIALRFSDHFSHKLRYVANWGHWLEWDGAVWRVDDTMKVFDYARAICRRCSSECNEHRVSLRLASASTIAAVLRLASSDRTHARSANQWDRDPWLLNTPGGTVDLCTGKVRDNRPEDHMTKITVAAPGGECPNWIAFLDKITLGDVALQSYLQRVAGYCLTGSTREHALFFGYGGGGNGKGTFVNTLTKILGSYATVAAMTTFIQSHFDQHPTELAMLRGARFVTAQETQEEHTWATTKIKAMTGGDPITARQMRQDFFIFQPTFKLFLIGNDKPSLGKVDKAIRRRFNLIPFNQSLESSEIDQKLDVKLAEEYGGILSWMIRGCLEWQRLGLSPPPAVTTATDNYMIEEDSVGKWISESCFVDRNYTSASSDLYLSWKAWADAAGEVAGSQKRLSRAIMSAGFEPYKDGNGRAAFRGLKLVPPTRRHYSDDF